MTISTIESLRPELHVTRVAGGVRLQSADFQPLDPFIDPDTGEPFLDPETGEPFYDYAPFFQETTTGGNVSVGMALVRDGNGWTTRPVRQRAFIETDVQYVAELRWRRQVVQITTPELTAD